MVARGLLASISSIRLPVGNAVKVAKFGTVAPVAIPQTTSDCVDEVPVSERIE